MLEGLGPLPEEGDERPQLSAGSFEDQVLLQGHPLPPPHTSCVNFRVQVRTGARVLLGLRLGSVLGYGAA